MVLKESLRKMRIVAIPLTRPRAVPGTVAAANVNLNRLTYYQFQISGDKEKGKQKETHAPTTTARTGWRAWPAQIREEGLVDWTTQKATEVWTGFGQAPGGWRLRVHSAGERLVDRMDFEELALKSVDPRLGPRIVGLARAADGVQPRIPLVVPPSQLSPAAALAELRAYAAHRIPRHRKGLYIWALVAPLTAPFMLIPIIPNLPFFFCVWRAWSHYRAYKASQYLAELLDHDIIVPEPSAELDAVYRSLSIGAPLPVAPTSRSNPKPKLKAPAPPPSPPPPAPDADSAKHTLLLTRPAVPALLSLIRLTPESTAATDLYRAVEQARMRVESGKLGL